MDADPINSTNGVPVNGLHTGKRRGSECCCFVQRREEPESAKLKRDKSPAELKLDVEVKQLIFRHWDKFGDASGWRALANVEKSKQPEDWPRWMEAVEELDRLDRIAETEEAYPRE